MRLRTGAALVLIAIGGLSLAACGPSKAAQCSEVIGLVNEATKHLEEGPSKPDADRAERIANLRAMTATMAKVAESLASAKTTVPELKDFSTRYQQLARSFVKLGNQMADGAEQNDADKQSSAREALDKIADDEAPLVTSVNEFCKGG